MIFNILELIELKLNLILKFPLLSLIIFLARKEIGMTLLRQRRIGGVYPLQLIWLLFTKSKALGPELGRLGQNSCGYFQEEDLPRLSATLKRWIALGRITKKCQAIRARLEVSLTMPLTLLDGITQTRSGLTTLLHSMLRIFIWLITKAIRVLRAGVIVTRIG